MRPTSSGAGSAQSEAQRCRPVSERVRTASSGNTQNADLAMSHWPKTRCSQPRQPDPAQSHSAPSDRDDHGHVDDGADPPATISRSPAAASDRGDHAGGFAARGVSHRPMPKTLPASASGFGTAWAARSAFARPRVTFDSSVFDTSCALGDGAWFRRRTPACPGSAAVRLRAGSGWGVPRSIRFRRR